MAMFRFSLIPAALLCLSLAPPTAGAEGARPPAVTVTVARAANHDIARQVVVSGTIRAWEEITVAAEAQGLAVVEVGAEEGDSVAAGALLLRLNDTVLTAQRAQQAANLEAARAVLAEASANLARARDLQPRGAVSRQSLDERLAAQRTAAANVAVAEAALAEIDARLSQTVIRAPVAGVVSLRSVNLGQVVNAGTELFRLIRDGRLELQAEVPETAFGRLRPGLAAAVEVDGRADALPATLRRLSPTLDPRTRLGIAYLALGPDVALHPGMFATARIDLGVAQLLMVPQASIVWRGGIEGVFLIGDDGIARFTPISTGLRRDGLVEIRGGIAEGDRIALLGAGFLSDGDTVGVAEARS
ncbi:efflux RND transporter periplasmic adaptor subunit [Zavarzinia aquatilis]|uniref:Efflux RND transporter periplasmic adaptor subunit n=1 Tax=Zavarzinia aquatilis TaxID=2211142 RepID=A0A317EGC8_9PROT|nr:efflux RND transporter periplasmic adaptor subunit [Zavarzinia aquatilis]PWR24473.1 efflux RND transporter periplasmic adaptor subunit [Zavarzinia aquatilis]